MWSGTAVPRKLSYANGYCYNLYSRSRRTRSTKIKCVLRFVLCSQWQVDLSPLAQMPWLEKSKSRACSWCPLKQWTSELKRCRGEGLIECVFYRWQAHHAVRIQDFSCLDLSLALTHLWVLLVLYRLGECCSPINMYILFDRIYCDVRGISCRSFTEEQATRPYFGLLRAHALHYVGIRAI